MSQKTGRNAPCPCGSGKKYKQCCLKKPSAGAGRSQGADGGFRFDPGAYGGPDFGYVPALLSEERIGDAWHPQFLLAVPTMPFDEWTQAAELATHHLDTAFAVKTTDGEEAAGRKLDSIGYKSVEDYRLEDFRSIKVPPGIAEGSEAFSDLEGRNRTRAAFLSAVDEQIRSGDPAETELTFERLVGAGHSEVEAKELIAALIAAEVFAVVKKKRDFDRELYEENLRRLPELPEELRD